MATLNQSNTSSSDQIECCGRKKTVQELDVQRGSQEPKATIIKIDATKEGMESVACSEEDFTVYVPVGPMKTILEQQADKKIHEPSIDASIQIAIPNEKSTISGRALIARCHSGEHYSISVRADMKNAARGTLNKRMVGIKFTHPGGSTAKLSNALKEFKPKASKQDETIGKFLYSFDVVVAALSSAIFSKTIKTGLIVISGTTGCGKSQITRGLIRDYLLGINWQKIRRPHLVTIEDPIEELARQNPPSPKACNSCGWDYTPRLLGVDVINLKQAIRDAKRMKPAIVFIGETREENDWKEVMEFAGSGHLVITTTHAGSLVETIQRVFKAVDATTPAGRGAAAESILAAIHLETVSMERPLNTQGVLPAVWKRSTAGSLGLVSDGLASILPGNPSTSEPKQLSQESSLGRHWFSAKIKSEFEKVIGVKRHAPANYDKVWEAFMIKAAALDLVTL